MGRHSVRRVKAVGPVRGQAGENFTRRDSGPVLSTLSIVGGSGGPARVSTTTVLLGGEEREEREVPLTVETDSVYRVAGLAECL